MASEEHHITVIILDFNKPITAFAITKENTRQLKVLLKKTEKEKELPDHLTDLSEFLSRNDSYYIEGLESKILIMRKERLLGVKEIISMHEFAKEFCKVMPSSE
jgi:hypothetical protein